MIRTALNFPPSGEHGSKAVVVGGVLFGLLAVVIAVASFFIETQFLDSGMRSLEGAESAWRQILPVLGVVVVCYSVVSLFLRGYDVAVLRTVVSDSDPTAPAFHLGAVFDGVRAVGILLCYVVPSLVLGFIGLSLRQPTSAGVSWIHNAMGAFALLFGLFALVVAAYLVPAATALFAARQSVWAAFDRSALCACVATEDYAVGWVVAALLRILLLPIAIALQGLLIGLFLRFYLRVSAQHLYGLSVSNALESSRKEY